MDINLITSAFNVLNIYVTPIVMLSGLVIAMRWLQLRRREVVGPRDLGPEGGGYILINLSENLKPFFHDLLKGFEEYAEIKGYGIKFSIDNTVENKIAFKFTVSKSGINVSTEDVRNDFQQYINNVQKEEHLDRLPIIITKHRHHALVTTLKNRINFLQHNYNAVRNVNQLYETILKDIATKGVGLSMPQNFYLMPGGTMQGNNYNAINSPQASQGTNAISAGNTIGSNVQVGNTFREKAQQIEKLDDLLKLVHELDSDEKKSKEEVIHTLSKVKDELRDEEKPDPSRIHGWLVKAKGYLDILKIGGELLKKAKEVYDSFGIAIP